MEKTFDSAAWIKKYKQAIIEDKHATYYKSRWKESRQS